MTPSEARDRIWEEMGGLPYQSGRWLMPLDRYMSEQMGELMGRSGLERYGYAFKAHPIRPSLDLLAALWATYAAGWMWYRQWFTSRTLWIAEKQGRDEWRKNSVSIPDTGSEVDDRTVLLALVMEASK